LAQQLFELNARRAAEHAPDSCRRVSSPKTQMTECREYPVRDAQRRRHARSSPRSHNSNGPWLIHRTSLRGERRLAPGSDTRLDLLVTKDVASAGQVMRAAEQAQVVGRRRTSERERVAVLEGQKAALGAAPALGVDERALGAIALPNRAPYLGRNMT
jgi:hypothetical protein